MTNRERFLKLMRGESVDRAPFFPCFGPWDETLARWHAEGLRPEDDWRKVVGFEGDIRNKIPASAWLHPMPERVVLQDEGETQIVVERGITLRVKKDGGSMPEFLSYPIEDASDWPRVKKLLSPGSALERLPANWDEICKANRKRQDPCYAGDLPCGFFGGPRELLGVERLSMFFYDEPKMIEDVLDTLCELWIELFVKAVHDAQIDFFFIWEDMCFKTGPLLGPELFRKFLLPRYKRLTGALRNAGVDIIMVDSDGDPRKLVDLWIEGGVSCVFPWETQMGLDITEVRKKHPKLQMIGGINKYALALGRDAINAELEKTPFMLESGRYLPALDHFVPPDVSWDNYRYFCERLRDLIERYPPCPSC